jgi:hypothetical protein
MPTLVMDPAPAEVDALLLVVDPRKRSVSWLALEHGEYRPIERSALIDLGQSDLAGQIDWP